MPARPWVPKYLSQLLNRLASLIVVVPTGTLPYSDVQSALEGLADGGGGGGGLETYIDTIDLTAWGSHEIDIDLSQAGYADTYDHFMLVLIDVKMEGGNTIPWIDASDDGFTTLIPTAMNLRRKQSTTTTVTTFSRDNLTNPRLMMSVAGLIPNNINGEIRIGGVNGVNPPQCLSRLNVAVKDSNKMYFDELNGVWNTITGITGIRISTAWDLVDWSAGSIEIYGVTYGA